MGAPSDHVKDFIYRGTGKSLRKNSDMPYRAVSEALISLVKGERDMRMHSPQGSISKIIS